jgi:hypothetical protein
VSNLWIRYDIARIQVSDTNRRGSRLTWELDLKKNILLGLAAVPSCTNTGVDEPPVPDLYSLKMYLPLNSLHNHTATATQDWADRALLPYARSHIMALLRTTS